ncbi:MAG: glycerol-3-phosphate acyltransferase [Chloroflexi bacterium]|nr:glycerol-3-phosphate acyltransferase [Chloroflexota bacterium]
MAEITLVLLAAYLLGSIPTAVIVVRRVAGVDVRTLGDGNMGARNVSRTLGWKPATVVAFVDFFKGTVPVLLAQQAGLVPAWQVAAARAAALGHDFPVFAGFRGGQGLGTILGAFLALALDALAFALTRLSDASARLGIVVIFVLMWRGGQPAVVVWCCSAPWG